MQAWILLEQGWRTRAAQYCAGGKGEAVHSTAVSMAHVEASWKNEGRKRSLAEDQCYCPAHAPGGISLFFHIDQHVSDRFNLFLNGYCIFHLVAKQEFHPRLPITTVEGDAGAAFEQLPIETPFLNTRKDASGKEGRLFMISK
jgi:hypothetical protein